MAFHEVRLPARLAFGSTGGIERRTEIVTLASGHERRSSPWAQGRRRYLIVAGLRSLDDMAAGRVIAKPVAGTVRIATDGEEIENFGVDLATGLATLSEPPAEGAVVTAGFEFDTPVRFDTDRIETTLESFEAGRITAAPLIEIRL